jgi:hypothetical protein
MLVEAPEEIRQEQMKGLVDKLFPQLTKKLRKEIEAGIEKWPVDPIELATQMAAVNGKETDSVSIKGGAAKKPAPKPASDSRQGQVTDKTK